MCTHSSKLSFFPGYIEGARSIKNYEIVANPHGGIFVIVSCELHRQGRPRAHLESHL